MDYVSKALASLNIGLPFTVTEEDPISVTGHEISQATWKKDSSKVSVLRYALDDPLEAERGRNAADVLRKLRIPGVARIVDTYETFDSSYVITERVLPIDFKEISEEGAKFVALSVSKTLEKMYEAGKCEYRQPFTEIVQSTQGLPVLNIFDTASKPLSPGWGSQSKDDSRAFTATRCNILTAAELTSLIDTVFVAYSTVRSQCLLRTGLQKASSSESHMGFNVPKMISLLEQTPFAELIFDADRIMLYDEHDSIQYCERLAKASKHMWPQSIRGFFLPQLIRTNKPCIFPAVLIMIAQLGKEKKQIQDETISNYIADQFKSMDRVIRLELSKAMPSYIELVTPQFVQTNIMPRMAFGFVDSEVIMRRASVASVEILATKLSSRQRNMDLLRLLAKTHADVDPEVRALTTTVLCKIAPQLDNRAVISTASARALKDPVAKCRAAASQGVSEINVPAKEIAEKLLGPAAVGMLDKDPKVSAEAWRVTNASLEKVQTDATASGPSSDVGNTDTSVDHIVGNSMSGMERSPMNNTAQATEATRPRFGARSETTTPAAVSSAAPTTAHDDDDNMPTEDTPEVEDAWGWDEEEAEAPAEDAEAVEDAWGWDDE